MKFWIDGTWTKMLQNSHHKENCFDLGIYKQGRYHSFSACFFLLLFTTHPSWNKNSISKQSWSVVKQSPESGGAMLDFLWSTEQFRKQLLQDSPVRWWGSEVGTPSEKSFNLPLNEKIPIISKSRIELSRILECSSQSQHWILTLQCYFMSLFN